MKTTKRVAVDRGLGLLICLGWLGAGCDSNPTMMAGAPDAAANSEVAASADAVADAEQSIDEAVEAAADGDAAPDLDAPVDAVSEDRSPSETTDLPLTDKRQVDIL